MNSMQYHNAIGMLHSVFNGDQQNPINTVLMISYIVKMMYIGLKPSAAQLWRSLGGLNGQSAYLHLFYSGNN